MLTKVTERCVPTEHSRCCMYPFRKGFHVLLVVADLRGTDYPKPLYDTRVKIRWDDTHLYVGAYLQDEHIWANKTKHDSHGKLSNN